MYSYLYTLSFQCLKMLGYSHVVLQTGAGDYLPTASSVDGVSIEHYKYKSSIKEDIETADLVISHAGKVLH